jgi:RNA 2',3'-cyclic 3'-phosphodiesterase
VRLFLAINFPPAVRAEIVAATAPLRETAPELAWVKEPLLHLTLKFLDEQPEERLESIQAALAGVAARNREPLLTLGEIGAFPNFRRTRIVWMGVAQEPRLELLHHDIEVAFEALGFEVDGRPFRPHLTLARAKHRLPEDRLRALARAAKGTEYRTDFIVHSIDLMQSTLGPGGPSYTTLVSAALRSG